MDFVCPICKGTLAEERGRTKKCINGHSFDCARQGYYNYLVGSSGGTHGDNRAMTDARREFLSGGYYSPLAKRVAALVREHTQDGGSLLDIGCGEGYYTEHMIAELQAAGRPAHVLAFDISKDAVKRLLSRTQALKAAVASAYRMPLPDGRIDTATLIFSPFAREEIARVIRPGGTFIMVFPGEMHLFGLKSVLYDTPYKNRPEPTEFEGFTLVSDEELSYEITLRDRMLTSLFMMTPYAYRTGEKNRKRLEAQESVTTEVAFRILVYKKV